MAAGGGQVDPIFIELAKICVLLPIVAVQGWFVHQQHKALRSAEEDRVEDLKTLNDRLIALSEKWNLSLNALIATTDAHKDVLREVRAAMKDLRDDLVDRMGGGR